MRLRTSGVHRNDRGPLTTYVHPAVTSTGGTFSVSLGDTLPLNTESIEAGQATWLGVQVGVDPELPRVRLHHVPYAMRATTAADLSCTGCVGAAQLAAGLLSAYAKTTVLEGLATADGSWTTPRTPTFRTTLRLLP